MSHGLKALLLAASTIITCIIVGLGFMMAREAKQLGNHVVEELHRYRIAIEEQDYTRYDGATIYGSDVVNLMKKELTDGKNGIYITVENQNGRYTYDKKEDIKRVQEEGTVYYIEPASDYIGELIRNQNEVIVEMVFTEKNNGGENYE